MSKYIIESHSPTWTSNPSTASRYQSGKKYDVDLYHYTDGISFKNIYSDMYLKPSGVRFYSSVPSVWFTTRETYEPTILCRAVYIYPFVQVQLKLSDRALQRRDVDIIRWSEYCSSGGYNGGFHASDEAATITRRMDYLDALTYSVDPYKEWFLCLDKVYLGHFDPPKVLYKGEWASICYLDAAIEDASKKGRPPLYGAGPPQIKITTKKEY